MCSSPKVPKPPAPPAEPPTQVDSTVTGAYDREQRRRRAAAGHSGTILTGLSASNQPQAGQVLLGG